MQQSWAEFNLMKKSSDAMRRAMGMLSVIHHWKLQFSRNGYKQPAAKRLSTSRGLIAISVSTRLTPVSHRKGRQCEGSECQLSFHTGENVFSAWNETAVDVVLQSYSACQVCLFMIASDNQITCCVVIFCFNPGHFDHEQCIVALTEYEQHSKK